MRRLVGTTMSLGIGALLAFVSPTPASAAPVAPSCTVTPVSTVGCTYKDFYGDKKHGNGHKKHDDDGDHYGPDGPPGPSGPPGSPGFPGGKHRHHHHHHGPPPVYGPADKWSSCYAYCQ
jgi:hypothetical protein